MLLSCLRPASRQSIVSRRSCAERALIKTGTLSGKWRGNSRPAGDAERRTAGGQFLTAAEIYLSQPEPRHASSERYWRITTDPNDLDVSLTTQRDVTESVTHLIAPHWHSVFLNQHLIIVSAASSALSAAAAAAAEVFFREEID